VWSDGDLVVGRRCGTAPDASVGVPVRPDRMMAGMEERRVSYRVAHADEAVHVYRERARLLGLVLCLLAARHFDDDVVAGWLVVDGEVVDAVDSLEVLWFLVF
jgi:hypothetical protein